MSQRALRWMTRAGGWGLLAILGFGCSDPDDGAPSDASTGVAPSQAQVAHDPTPRDVQHLLDPHPRRVIDLVSVLYQVGRLPVVQTMQDVVERGGAQWATLPWPARATETLEVSDFLRSWSVFGVRDEGARDALRDGDACVHITPTTRWRVPDLDVESLKTTRDAVHETATLLLREDDSFVVRVPFLEWGGWLRLWAGGPATGTTQLRCALHDQDPREGTPQRTERTSWELTGTDERAVEWSLPSGFVDAWLEVSLESLEVEPAANEFRLRLQWIDLERSVEESVLLGGKPADQVLLTYAPQPPDAQLIRRVASGSPGWFVASGGPVTLRALGDGGASPAAVTVKVDGVVCEDGQPLNVPSGLRRIDVDGDVRLEISQPSAHLLPYFEDPDASLDDDGLEATSNMDGVAKRLAVRLPSASDTRAGWFLPTPSALSVDEMTLRAGDRLRGSVAIADGCDGARPPRAAGRVEVTWARGDQVERLAQIPFDPASSGWTRFEVVVDEAHAGTGTLGVHTVADDGTECVPVLIGDPRIVPPADVQPERPNVLLYLVDTLRATRLGAYGHEEETSPWFDRIASEGYRFAQFRAVASWTRPSVASMITGTFPQWHGIQDDGAALPARAWTLAEAVRGGGWSTWASVANVQVSARGVSFEQGYHRFVGPEALGIDDPKMQLEPSSRHIALPAKQWLEEDGDEPWFLNLHSMDPHLPYRPPEEYRGTIASGYDGPLKPRHLVFLGELWALAETVLTPPDFDYLRAVYDEEIRCQDDELAALWAWLEEAGHLENTVVVLYSDHGEEFFEHGKLTHAARMWEELLHVPLVMWIPPRWRERWNLAEPHVIETPVSQVDLFPSLLELLDLPSPPQQGRSFVPLLRGESAPTHGVYSQETAQLGAWKSGPWKLLWEPQDVWYRYPQDGLSVQTGRKEVLTRLFHLGDDPGEQRDLANERPDELMRLRRELADERRRLRECGVSERSADARYGASVDEQLRAMGYLVGEDEATEASDEPVEVARNPSGVEATYLIESEHVGSLSVQDDVLHWRVLRPNERRQRALPGLGPERLYDLTRGGAPMTLDDLDRLQELLTLKLELDGVWDVEHECAAGAGVRVFDAGSLMLLR